MDVFEQEPKLDPENPLFKLNNVVLSPHTATMTQEAIKKLERQLRIVLMRTKYIRTSNLIASPFKERKNTANSDCRRFNRRHSC